MLELKYDALGRWVEAVDYTKREVRTRYVYSGLETIEEYVLSGSAWTLARESLWGADHIEPLAMIDWTDAGQQPPARGSYCDVAPVCSRKIGRYGCGWGPSERKAAA